MLRCPQKKHNSNCRKHPQSAAGAPVGLCISLIDILVIAMFVQVGYICKKQHVSTMLMLLTNFDSIQHLILSGLNNIQSWMELSMQTHLFDQSNIWCMLMAVVCSNSSFSQCFRLSKPFIYGPQKLLWNCLSCIWIQSWVDDSQIVIRYWLHITWWKLR